MSESNQTRVTGNHAPASNRTRRNEEMEAIVEKIRSILRAEDEPGIDSKEYLSKVPVADWLKPFKLSVDFLFRYLFLVCALYLLHAPVRWENWDTYLGLWFVTALLDMLGKKS